MSFSKKLILLVVMVLLLTQLVSGLAVLFATDRYAARQVSEELSVAAGVLDDQLQREAAELSSRLNVLSDDFGFRQAMATGDQATIESVLVNHGERLGAGLVMYADRDGLLLASTHHDPREEARFPVPAMLQGRQGSRGALLALDGAVYLVSAVPVRAPALIGWVAMGVPFGERFATHFYEVTGKHLAIWLAEEARVIRSGMPPALGALMQDGQAARVALASSGIDQRALIDGEYFLSRPDLEALPLEGVRLFLLGSLQQASAVYGPLKNQLLLISAMALLVSVLLAIVTGQRLAAPVRDLVTAAKRIQGGNYLVPVKESEDRELGGLAAALNQMQQAISQRESHISFQAQHDALTGLANRSVANDRLETAIQRAQRKDTSVAVILLDLDRFKEVNDVMGHMTGDLLLKEVANRLKQAVRATDTVSRLGGDEFLVILEEGSEQALLAVSEAIFNKVNGSAEVGEFRVQLNASVGVAFFPQHGDEAESLMRRADIAMYSAKAQSVRFVVYEPGQDEAHLRQVQLINELPEAMNSGQFSMHYQPKANARTLEVGSAEALVRWQHPEFGFVSPEEFISLAEHSGLIRQLTRWVIREVMMQQARWRRQGLELNVSINLSAMDLIDTNFPSLLLSYSRLHEVPAECLTLEITESTIMTDTAVAESVLQRLRDDGYTISIDDYGTGFSSLAQMKRMPVSELKIDKSFVLNLDSNEDDEVIVRSTISMAKSLGIKVVVEGVENEQTLNMLRAWGANTVQGYYLSRPLSASAFEEWIADRPEFSGTIRLIG